MVNRVSWERRPTELANLFNPSFLAILLAKVAEGYNAQSSKDLPYSVAFLAIPLVIFPSFNQLLPKSAITKLHSWLTENQDILFEFPELSRSLSPYVREAISFGISNQILTITLNGNLISKEINIKKWERDHHNIEITKKALIVGKLLGQITQTHTLFSIFGVRP